MLSSPQEHKLFREAGKKRKKNDLIFVSESRFIYLTVSAVRLLLSVF